MMLSYNFDTGIVLFIWPAKTRPDRLCLDFHS